jgi:hypothetical protein
MHDSLVMVLERCRKGLLIGAALHINTMLGVCAAALCSSHSPGPGKADWPYADHLLHVSHDLCGTNHDASHTTSTCADWHAAGTAVCGAGHSPLSIPDAGITRSAAEVAPRGITATPRCCNTSTGAAPTLSPRLHRVGAGRGWRWGWGGGGGGAHPPPAVVLGAGVASTAAVALQQQRKQQ